MGFFSRLGRMIRGNVNALLDAAENPEKTLEQAIRDMQDNYNQAKDRVAQAMVEERRLQKKLEEQRQEAVGWKGKAQLAVTRGDDSLAKAALVRYKASQDLATQLEKDLAQHNKNVEALKQGLVALEQKIEDCKRQKKTLLTRKHIAETRMQLSTTVTEVKETDAFHEFDRIANKIEEMELKSGVMMELSGDTVQSDVKLLEESTEVDSELAKLKAEMGVEPK